MKAFPEYKDNPSWIVVAKYLFGEDTWKDRLGLNVVVAEPPPDDDDESEHSTEENNPLNPLTIAEFMKDFPCDMEHDLGCEKLEKYVTDDGSDDDSSDGSLLGENEPEMDHTDGMFFLNENDAASEFNRWSTGAKKSALKFLKLHVHSDHLKKSVGYKDVVKWLQSPNAVRNYLFYTSKGLKALMSARKLTFASGHASVDRMISALAGLPGNEAQQITNEDQGADTSDAMSPVAAATKAILVKSFLPHQKGEKREHCSLGHRLEIPILRNFISSIRTAREYNGIIVRGAYSAGLAAKVGKPYAKDSIDFVLAVDDPEEEGITKIWGFEAKGRVTVGTAATEEDHQYALRCSYNKHLRINHDEVHEEICREGERWQIMHHAYVYDMDTVVYAIGDSGAEIIRTLVVDFSGELKDHFGNVLEELKKVALSWAYPEQPANARRTTRLAPLQIPDEIIEIASTIPSINGADTVRSTANLWHSMRLQPLPLPALRRLIPAIYAYWNSVKGGSDTTTKLMDDCLVQIPKCHMNTETVAVSRLVMLVYVLNHRLSQINSGKDDLGFYKSLFNWRQAASARTTFHSTLLQHHQIFKKMLTDMQEAPAGPPSTPIRHVSPSSPPRRTRGALVDGVMPQTLDLIAPRLPTQTPKKIVAFIRNGTASEPIQEMVKHCTGIPMQIFPLKSNYTCAICKKSTSWYCAGCKRWVCLNVKGGANSKQREIYSKKFGDNQKHFTKACFHIMHEKAWERKNRNELED